MKWFAGMALATSLIVVPAVARAQSAPVDTKADIEKVATDWMNAYNNKDATTLAQMYAEDAAFSAPGWTASGRAAIAEGFSKEIASGIFSKVNAITVEQSHRVGDLNYAMGAWAADMNGPEGKVVPVGGHWVVVGQYKDGHYIALLHNANMQLPPPK